MPTIYRISRASIEPVTDVNTIEAIEPEIRDCEPGRYHMDEISSEPLPSGHTSRR